MYIRWLLIVLILSFLCHIICPIDALHESALIIVAASLDFLLELLAHGVHRQILATDAHREIFLKLSVGFLACNCQNLIRFFLRSRSTR